MAAWNVFGQITGQEPAANVMVVADGVSDNQPDLLVAVEVQRSLPMGRGNSTKCEEEQDRENRSFHGHSRWAPAAWLFCADSSGCASPGRSWPRRLTEIIF